MDAERFHFLFQQDKGEIDRAAWGKYAAYMAGLVLLLTLPWLWARHHIVHDLSKDPLFAPEIFLAYFYAVLYGVALMLIGASYMNLTAKRFRALRWPSPLGFASLAPLVAYLAAALRLAPILSSFLADYAPTWAIWGSEAAFMAVAAWTAWELGVKKG
ncbi:hypothetical protein [Methylocystis bryophila]|uniref:DUF805 domain-containing protein n=1 Tax=Methylocystis bryophila TaxID=655015 RepID=A0A1W6MR96_9HYPH|nr:hypothetical protein [Methylocystis bryophila]ARN80097.1 hypothetical protein B1812_02265 [Methylocystis bryophila]BDV40027.1 hypothetical protein DSM21852_32800 [Methylocystis bryophila]